MIRPIQSQEAMILYLSPYHRLFSFSAKNWQSIPEPANISCEGNRRDLKRAARHP